MTRFVEARGEMDGEFERLMVGKCCNSVLDVRRVREGLV